MGQRWHVGVAISKHCEGADPSSCTNGRKAQCQKHSSQQDVCTQATFSSWPWGTNLPRKEPSTCGVHCSEDKKMPTNLSLKPDELNLRQKTKNMLFPRRYFCHIITKCYRKHKSGNCHDIMTCHGAFWISRQIQWWHFFQTTNAYKWNY
jgi:hypothetical protein